MSFNIFSLHQSKEADKKNLISPVNDYFTAITVMLIFTKFINFKLKKKEILINWVNSLEYPNCLLASDIEDFKNGIRIVINIS